MRKARRLKSKNTQSNSQRQWFSAGESMVAIAYSNLLGKEEKFKNIIAVHGYAPRAVWEELYKAELEYGFWKAMSKD